MNLTAIDTRTFKDKKDADKWVREQKKLVKAGEVEIPNAQFAVEQDEETGLYDAVMYLPVQDPSEIEPEEIDSGETVRTED